MIRLEHLGIAVENPEAVSALFAQLFEIVPYKTEAVMSENVETIFLGLDNAKLELLRATSPDSAVAKYLEKRGEGLHHVAFEVRDLDAAFLRIKEAGFQILNPEPKQGADGKRIFFLHPKQTHGILIEFCASTSDPLVRQPLQDETQTGFSVGNAQNPRCVYLVEKLADADIGLVDALSSSYFVEVMEANAQHWAISQPTFLLAQRETGTFALEKANEFPDLVSRVCVLDFVFDKAATKALAILQQPLLLICDEHHLEASHYFSLKSFVQHVQIAVLPTTSRQSAILLKSIIAN